MGASSSRFEVADYIKGINVKAIYAEVATRLCDQQGIDGMIFLMLLVRLFCISK